MVITSQALWLEMLKTVTTFKRAKKSKTRMVDMRVQKRPLPEKGLSAPRNLRVYPKEGPVNASHNNLCHSFMDRTVTVASSVVSFSSHLVSFSSLLRMLPIPLTENQMHKHTEFGFCRNS